MFFKNMKIPFLIVLATLIFSSCGKYQEVLRSDDAAKKLAFADSLYQKGKYKKALKLMEEVVPVYRGKPEAERLLFMYANTFYNMEDYYLAGYQFERFEISYPTSDSIEFAAYRSAKSYYELSPRYTLDQTDTHKALEKLQAYINKYPNSEYRVEANTLVKELQGKLELKDISIAKQYLNVEDYKAAIEAFDNFITDHPGSEHRPYAFFGKMDAAYRLALRSVPSLVEGRLLEAKEYYESFAKYYKDNELNKEAEEILADINKRLTAPEPTS